MGLAARQVAPSDGGGDAGLPGGEKDVREAPVDVGFPRQAHRAYVPRPLPWIVIGNAPLLVGRSAISPPFERALPGTPFRDVDEAVLPSAAVPLFEQEQLSGVVGHVDGREQRPVPQYGHEQAVEGGHVEEVELPARAPVSGRAHDALRLPDQPLELGLHLGRGARHFTAGKLVRGGPDDEEIEAHREDRERQEDQRCETRQKGVAYGPHADAAACGLRGRGRHGGFSAPNLARSAATG
jgi:hypothetical protein